MLNGIFDLTSNLGLAALLVVIWNQLRDHAQKLGARCDALLLGCVMGGGSVAAMLMPIELTAGLFFDLRTTFVAVGGLFGGPLAAAFAMAIALAYRIYVGGIGTLSGCASLVFVAILAAAANIRLRARPVTGRILTRFAARTVMVGLSSFLLLPSSIFVAIVPNVLLPYALVTFVGIILLGLVFLQETRRRELQGEIAQKERQLRQITDNIPGFVFSRLTGPGAELTDTFISSGSAAVLGYAPDELVDRWGKNGGIIHPLDRARYDELAGRAAATMQPLDFTGRMRHADASWRWIHARSVPRFSAAGVIAWDGIALDVTAKVEAEQRLAWSETRFRAIFDSSLQFTGLLDPQGTVLEINRTALEFASVERTDVVGQPFWVLRLWRDDEDGALLVREAVRRASAGELVRYDAEVGRDGHPRAFLDISLKPIRDEDGAVRLVVFEGRDVTERKLAEEPLQASKARLEDFVEVAADGVVTIDEDGVIQTVNPAATRLFGHPVERMVGQNVTMLMPESWHDEADLAVRRYEPDGQRRPIGAVRELQGLRADGSVFPMELVVTEVVVHGRRLITGIVRDLALRHQAEKLRLAKETAEARAGAEAQFLANMSHELRTPLAGIIGFAELMLEGVNPERQKRFLRMQMEAGKALLTVVNDILDFDKLQSGSVRVEAIPFKLPDLVESCSSLVRHQAKRKGLTFAVRLGGGLPDVVNGDPTRVRQVLLNLLTNAIKFTASGQVTLSVERGSEDDRVRFAVVDSGPGIAPEKIPLLFNRFSQLDRSTTRRYGGTGLGLAISKRLVELMGGELGVDSIPGEGSSFSFELPMPADGGSALPIELASQGPLSILPRRILLAEDNDTLRQLISTFLEVRGHDVASVADGAAAVQAVGRDTFDVVLMDMQMPVMDGLAAMRALRESYERCPPIIALTASALATDVARCRAAGAEAHVAKPVDWNVLLATIERVCDEGIEEPPSQPVPPTCPEQRPALFDSGRVLLLEEMMGAQRAEGLLASFRTKVKELVAALDRTTGVESGTPSLAILAHQLAGSAGMFGFAELSERARSLEGAAQLGQAGVEAKVEACIAVAGRSVSALDDWIAQRPDRVHHLRLPARSFSPDSHHRTVDDERPFSPY